MDKQLAHWSLLKKALHRLYGAFDARKPPRDQQGIEIAHRYQVDLIHANSGVAVALCAPIAQQLGCKLVGHLHAHYNVLDRF